MNKTRLEHWRHRSLVERYESLNSHFERNNVHLALWICGKKEGRYCNGRKEDHQACRQERRDVADTSEDTMHLGTSGVVR